MLDLRQCRDGVIHVHGVALITEPHDWAVGVPPQGTNGLFYAAEAGVSVRILLREDRDLLRREPLHFHQIVNHGGSFFGVAGAVVEHIAVGRIASEQAGAGERSEKQHLAIEGIG